MDRTVPAGAALLLGRCSRWMNRALGGHLNETLCGRMARTRGHDCWFCRVVGWVLRDPDHCWAQRVHEIKNR